MKNEQPIDLFEKRIHREMHSIITDYRLLNDFPEVLDCQNREQIRLTIFLNKFYNKIPDREGIPIKWRQSLKSMVGENRHDFEKVLSGLRKSTIANALKGAFGNKNSDDLDDAVRKITKNHSEMMVFDTGQKFIENIEVAIGLSGIDREVLMKHLDSIMIRRDYNELTAGILISSRDVINCDCIEASLKYLDSLNLQNKPNDHKIKFAESFRLAISDNEKLDFDGMEKLLMSLNAQLKNEFLSIDQANLNLLLPVFIELRRMGYTVQDLRM